MFIDQDKLRLKIMLLQIRRRYSQFVSLVNGDLVQKKSRQAHQIAQQIREQFTNDVAKLAWHCPKRASIAVTMHFFPNNNQFPGLHNLVKFYLDLLKGIVFSDDRQVAYLEAQCSRSPEIERDADVNPVLYLHVESLVDYKLNFDLYVRLSQTDEFEEYFKDRYHHTPRIDWDENIDQLNADMLEKELYGTSVWEFLLEKVPRENIEKVKHFYEMETQRKWLTLNRIDFYDRPGGPKPDFLRPQIAKLKALQPFSINLGDLPQRGETKLYKRRIRERLQELKQNSHIGQIIVPVELDVKVTSESLVAGKDLDNIMLDVAPAVQAELLNEKAYLYGYRIYVTDLLPINENGNIEIKLLPEGSIYSFREEINERLKAAQEWIAGQL